MSVMSDRSRLRRLVAAGAGLLVWAAYAVPAAAQYQDCGDTIALYSPTGFSAVYEVAPGPQRTDGVRLRWDEIPDSLAGCVRLDADPALAANIGVELRGLYRNSFDRRIDFGFPAAGQIADPTQARFELAVNNQHKNPAAGVLSSTLNLSSIGGIYRFTPQSTAGPAIQVNSGIPPHLGDVVVSGFAEASDKSVLYAAVVGVPVMRSYNGGMTWEEPVDRIFPPFSQRMTAIAVFPGSPDRLWVGVQGKGVWESMDAGASFQQIFPAGASTNSNIALIKFLRVTGPAGTPVDRLYLSVRGQRLAYSDDQGMSFQAAPDFSTPATVEQAPTGAVCDSVVVARLDVNTIVVSPNDPSRVYVGVSRWGVYAGNTQTHSVWNWRGHGIVVCDSDVDVTRPYGEQRTVTKLVALNNAGTDLLMAATDRQAPPPGIQPDLRSATVLFVSTDAGSSWSTKGDGYPLNQNDDPVTVSTMIADPRPSRPLAVMVATFGSGVWEINLAGGPGQGNWTPVNFTAGNGIKNGRTASLYVAPNGDILVGTADSGIYQAGVWIDLTRALNRNAQSIDAVVSLGLQVRFTNPGILQGGEAFSIRAQNYRGYAVWRARDFDNAKDEPLWELIGLLDLANPEFCVEGTCDLVAQPSVVNCFANKRANCFVPQKNADQVTTSWEFFDRDVFNGFTYWYAVSSFDYGYTGETSVEAFNGGMLFSPRWPNESDPSSAIYNNLAGGQNSNGELFQVNVATVTELRDDEIFVVPNPLVRSAGWDLGNGGSVRIVNVTSSSKAEIYTVAGDLVREIENVTFAGVERGNIEWDTRNAEGEPVASGVYIYRVTDDAGGEVIGRFTIIR